MCNYDVTLSNEQLAVVNYDAQRLAQMEADGIVSVDYIKTTNWTL